MSRPLPENRDERLALLADSLERADLRGIDPAALASEFEVTTAEVDDAVRVARAFEAACGEDLPPDLAPPVPLPPGHELVSELGRGGMGVVYRVHHRALGRDVALKTLRVGGPDSPSAARFEREIRALARLRHPHIVRVFEGGEIEGVQYFTMELVEGQSLADVIGDGLGIARSVRLLTAIASAVEHAHEQGLIHRDLKPSNILLDENGAPFVVDFGLAREAAGPADGQRTVDAPTLTGQIVGTPAYMSPEQAAGIPAGEAADIYALGAVLYECLTTKRPFGEGSVPEVLWRVMHEDAPGPRSLAPAIPRPLEIICQHAMRKDPSRRYTSARAFAGDLERFSAGQPILAQPPGKGERLRLWLRRRASHLVTAALAVLFASILTQLVFGGGGNDLSAEQQLAAARELEEQGDHGAARRAYGAALDGIQHDFDRIRTLTAWLAATSTRAAELVRLGEIDRAQELIASGARREATVARLANARIHTELHARLVFEWLRLGAFARVHPELSWTSQLFDWQTLTALEPVRNAAGRLRRALFAVTGVARDPSLALLLHLDATTAENATDWQTAALGQPDRWFTEALRAFDRECPLDPDRPSTAAAKAYVESAPAHLQHGAETLATLLAAMPASLGDPDNLARRPLRARLALLARHDLGPLHVIWEERREFGGPTVWQVERDDRLPGPLSMLDLRLTLPGYPMMDALGHRREIGGIRSSIELSIGFLDLEHELWSGRSLHIDVDRYELTPQLRHSHMLRGWSNIALEPGTVVSLGTLTTTWKPVDDSRLWTFHLLLAIDDRDAPEQSPGLDGWRRRIRDSVANQRRPGRRPTFDNELWSRLDPVLDLAVHDAHDDALWLLENAPSHAPSAAAPWLRFARLALSGAPEQPADAPLPTDNRPGRDIAADCAWLITRAPDERVRQSALDLLDRTTLFFLPAGVRHDLQRASAEQGFTLPAQVAAAVAGQRYPGGNSAWRDLGIALARPFVLGVLVVILINNGITWLRRRRRPQRARPARQRDPALWLTGFGLTLSCIVVGANGWLLPDWLGPLLAAAGSLWWTLTAPNRSARRERRLAAPCFLIAAVMAPQVIDIALFTGIPLLLGLTVILVHRRRTSVRRWEKVRRDLRSKPPRKTSTLTNAAAAQ